MTTITKHIRPLQILFGILLLCLHSSCTRPLITTFPIKQYNQSTDNWIKPTSANYDRPLLTSKIQHRRFTDFYQHYFGVHSPWSAQRIGRLFRPGQDEDIAATQIMLIKTFDNRGKSKRWTGYAENYQAYSSAWIERIAANMNVAQFSHLHYTQSQRAIAVANTPIRALPTNDVFFYHYTIPGQGYPFDNLQMSALWVGTPVYVLGETRDQAWKLVLTPECIGWVQTASIAMVDQAFVTRWSSQAAKHLAAITHTETILRDAGGKYLATAYIGTVLPAVNVGLGTQLLVPRNDGQQAVIQYSRVSKQEAALMPLRATPRHFATLVNQLVGRPYGWGNLYFYNDCSGELKNLFTPFAIWLPRNSHDQLAAGKMTNLSHLSTEQRLNYLKQHGKPLLTLIYVGGHIMLYVGNEQLTPGGPEVAISYQNVWGLIPRSATGRAVIGKAAFLPLKAYYPETPSLTPQAAHKYFKLVDLSQFS